MTPTTSLIPVQSAADRAASGEPVPQPPAPSAISAACRHLLSKGMFVTGMVDPAEVGMSDGHCWCNKTQHALGPDDGLVARHKCIVGRRCYEPR